MRDADVTARVVALQRRPAPDDDDAIAVEGYRPIVPDGTYDAKFIGHDTMLLFRQPKVFLRFAIVQHGEFFDQGIWLPRPYRVRRVAKPVGANGKFVLDGGGDLYRMLLQVLDVRLRKDRISLHALKHLPLRISTRTVIVDRKGKPLPEAARYSVVEDIMRAE
jgi:hypothetical protein